MTLYNVEGYNQRPCIILKLFKYKQTKRNQKKERILYSQDPILINQRVTLHLREYFCKNEKKSYFSKGDIIQLMKRHRWVSEKVENMKDVLDLFNCLFLSRLRLIEVFITVLLGGYNWLVVRVKCKFWLITQTRRIDLFVYVLVEILASLLSVLIYHNLFSQL